MRCCVASCKTNKSKTSKISLFGIPKTDTIRFEWEKALGVRFKSSSKVCRDHFKEADIIDTWVSGKGLTKYTVNFISHNHLSNCPVNLLTYNDF